MNNTLKKLLPEEVSRFAKTIVLNFQKYYFAGDSYYCPICESSFRKMLTGGFDLEVIKEKQIIGAGLRPNTVCPYCQSTDRDRLIFLYFKNKLDIFNQKLKILHIAPEPALYKFLKKQKNLLYYTGTKYSEGIYFHQNIDSVDLLQIPYKDEEFDLVICNHVLEHIVDDAKAMSEIFRVIYKGGSAILQVPISNIIDSTYEDETITISSEREKHFGQFDHVRIYGKDYVNRLENAGFRVETYNAFKDNSNHEKLNKLSLNKNENLFIAHKDK